MFLAMLTVSLSHPSRQRREFQKFRGTAAVLRTCGGAPRPTWYHLACEDLSFILNDLNLFSKS